MKMRKRKHKASFRVMLTLKAPAELAALMNSIPPTRRDALVAKILRRALK